jgi:hypothetical protein
MCGRVRDLIWGKDKAGGGYEIEPLFTAVEAAALRLDKKKAAAAASQSGPGTGCGSRLRPSRTLPHEAGC